MQPPKRLKGDARKKWLELFTNFSPTSPLDTEAAAQYCEAWADYLRARKTVEKEGCVAFGGKNGAPYPHPAIAIQNNALKTMQKIWDRFTKLKLIGETEPTKGEAFSDV